MLQRRTLYVSYTFGKRDDRITDFSSLHSRIEIYIRQVACAKPSVSLRFVSIKFPVVKFYWKLSFCGFFTPSLLALPGFGTFWASLFKFWATFLAKDH